MPAGCYPWSNNGNNYPAPPVYPSFGYQAPIVQPDALPLATLQQYLSQAQAAYHALQTGTAVVNFTDQNGERVQYTQMNAGQLDTYIQDLNGRILAITNPQCYPNPGPISFFF